MQSTYRPWLTRYRRHGGPRSRAKKTAVGSQKSARMDPSMIPLAATLPARAQEELPKQMPAPMHVSPNQALALARPVLATPSNARIFAEMTFAELGLSPKSLAALDRAGFEAPTPIQSQAM